MPRQTIGVNVEGEEDWEDGKNGDGWEDEEDSRTEWVERIRWKWCEKDKKV